MQDLGRLETDPLFLALTRPAMVAGVSYMWLSLEGLTWLIVFINTHDFGLVIPGAAITHALGMLIGREEPRFLELMTIKAKTCNRCKNAKLHGNTHSYDLYK